MNHSILYYPTIEFQPRDYQWLWNAALFSDKIYRIVPPEYDLYEPENIKELCSTGEIGLSISPVQYAKDVSKEFVDFMENNQHQAAALSLDEENEKEYIKIHSSKMDVKLISEFFYKIKEQSQDSEWFYANPNIANFYMTFLANHIAKKNGLALWTGVQELWTTSTYFLNDGMIQNGFFPGEDYVEPSVEALLSVMIPEIFPQDIISVSPREILEFRRKRKDERINFLNALGDFREKVGAADCPEVLRTIINDEKKKLDDATLEYKKSMDILKVVKFGGILTTVITLISDALGYFNNVPDLCKNILGSSGVWTDILTGMIGKRINHKENPYSYLAHIDSNFSFHSRAQGGLLNRYNYTLYRGLEEFIND